MQYEQRTLAVMKKRTFSGEIRTVVVRSTPRLILPPVPPRRPTARRP
jgi:hypothetical protein